MGKQYPVLLLLFSLSFFCRVYIVRSGDAETLLALKSSFASSSSLPWRQEGEDNVCKWQGVRDCLHGRISKLVLENLNLTGSVDSKILNRLDQLRVLSFKGNSLSGPIPNLSGLSNLKSLYLNNNNFSGEFPTSLPSLHRLKVIVLSSNRISGEIPPDLVILRRLYVLNLDNNQLSGKIPPLDQTSLRFFNVSNNKLSGEIPITPALIRFNQSAFSGNIELCGEQVHNRCPNRSLIVLPPSLSPGYLPSGPNPNKSHHAKLVKIIAGSVGGFVLLLICLLLSWMTCRDRGRRRGGSSERGVDQNRAKGKETTGEAGEAGSGGNGRKQGGFSWEEEGVGSLVFCGPGDQQMSYSMEDLLRASAETLGRGTLGSTYKAVMESGFIVTVKRLKDAKYPRLEEFRRHVDLLGKLRHTHLVPLRAYFQTKEERLLVYDYFPNGSLFSLIHGSRTSDGGKPLHWTSCLKIAEDLAAGLLYIHQNPGLTHGNLKSSNVLLGAEFESCLTDYGLATFRNPNSQEEPSAAALFYRAPECRDMRRPPTQAADVFSFGVLLLELLTGKTPFQDLVQEYGADIPKWVQSVREDEIDSGDEPASGNESSGEKLQVILNIAVACVSVTPENRPAMTEILKMIRGARSETHVSSSSDHSPGRWSDTIQSLPRDEHLI